MKLEKEFVVGVPVDRVAKAFDDDETYTELFPDTELTSSRGGVRETKTHFQALGQARDVRFVFETEADGNVQFHKICDGNVWRSLEGRVQIRKAGESRTRISLRMEGRTRALVPELTIRGPMREQFDQMVSSLRERLSQA